MTPQEFEDACGTNNNKYLENIQTEINDLGEVRASQEAKERKNWCDAMKYKL